VPEDGGLIGQALIGVHTYTKSQTPSTRSRGLGWRIHESVEDTKLSTNKQHSLSLGSSASPSLALPQARLCSYSAFFSEKIGVNVLIWG